MQLATVTGLLLLLFVVRELEPRAAARACLGWCAAACGNVDLASNLLVARGAPRLRAALREGLPIKGTALAHVVSAGMEHTHRLQLNGGNAGGSGVPLCGN